VDQAVLRVRGTRLSERLLCLRRGADRLWRDLRRHADRQRQLRRMREALRQRPRHLRRRGDAWRLRLHAPVPGGALRRQPARWLRRHVRLSERRGLYRQRGVRVGVLGVPALSQRLRLFGGLWWSRRRCLYRFERPNLR
jgi:hypothetical protein